jgi:hypothetical protein
VRVAALPAFVIALLLGAASARADATCITAYEQTQTLRKDEKLIAAKAQAAICSRDSCPALLSKDCAKWLAELENVIPTVILDPRAPTGALRADARVKVDGARFAGKIDGKPFPLDPGNHLFVFEADGAAPVESRLIVKEGDKNLKVTVTVTVAPAGVSSSGDGAKPSDRPIPIGVWIFGGATVVALGTSAFFAIDGLGKKSDLDKCKPRCAASDVDAMSSSFTLADVALGAGVMAGAAAVYLFLTRPTAESSTAATSTARARTVPFAAPLPGGGAVGLSASF